jgi:3-dehydroquinate synthase
MKVVRVNLGQRGYDILIGGELLVRVGALFRSHGVGRKIFLVANPTVYDLFGPGLTESLAAERFDVVHLAIPDGEPHKNLHTVENIYTYLIAQKADRRSTLVALGGGVTGDVVGFVAATFMRGVPYVQIPTTLLAQVDSSVGGKTGVNHRLGKNLIGAFHQPHLVCVDTTTLGTLPEREFRAGLYEVLKYGLIYDREFFRYVAQNLDRIVGREAPVLEKMIGRCCEIKAETIALDEREENQRRTLNFGHTLGHALEAATEYQRFLHGEAVAYGMLAAAHLSHRRGLVDADTLREIGRAVLAVGPLPSAADIAFSALAEALRRDKKRRDDSTVLVLLTEIGHTVIESGFDDQLLAEVWARAVAEVEA